MGTSGPKKNMAVSMTRDNNGQAITLSKKLAKKGAVDTSGLAKPIKTEKREYTFAQTFPIGTRAMWLNYWLASAGIHRITDAKSIVVPPQQIVANTQSTVVMVTHDADEAVLLSDRVVMKANGLSATIGGILAIELPRSRHRATLAESTQYLHYRKAVLDFLSTRQSHVKKVSA